MRKILRATNISEVEKIAKSALPKMIFEFISGGSEDEITLARNANAFKAIKFSSRILRNVAVRDQSTHVCGTRLSSPLLLSPVGLTALAHPGAEIAAARAAEKHGITSVLSTASSRSIEDVASKAGCPLWFQLYPWKSRDLTACLLDRAQRANYATLCVTVDVPIHGSRERDIRNGMTIPPRLNLTSAVDILSRPAWCIRQALAPSITMANLAGLKGVPSANVKTLAAWASQLLNPAFDWTDFSWLRDHWKGPLIIKGIMSPEDARIAADHGADGVIVSNHGGRQLDGLPATIDALPAIAKAVSGQVDVLLDGGIRRGSDVVKALALGAKACLIGRPYVYGLAAGGQAGVERVLEIFRSEIDRVMALLGCTSLNDIDASILHDRKEHS